MKKLFFAIFTTFILGLMGYQKVLAQVDTLGINDLADGGVALGTKSIQETVSGIVNIALGFLGILAVLLIIYGGVLWMTSRGNADKVQRAKLVLVSAVIGLVIIVSAYAIARFILDSLYDVAGPTAPVACVVNGDCATNCCSGGFCQPTSYCSSGLPTCPEPLNLTEPDVCSLSRTSGPAGSYLTIRGWHFETDGNDATLGEVRINGTLAEFVTCGGNPIWEDTYTKVKIPDIPPGAGYNVDLINDVGQSPTSPPLTFEVVAGTPGPNIACLIPSFEAAGNLPAPVIVEGVGFGTAVDTLEMQGYTGGVEVTLGNADLNISNWQETQIDFTVPDNAISSNVRVTVGTDAAQEYFNITCNNDTDCGSSSGCCYNSYSCRADSYCAVGVPGGPQIDYIDPPDGEMGNLVTIYGSGFGATQGTGTVLFDGTAGTVPANPPANPLCTDTWNDNYIIVAVPDAVAGVGQVTVTTDAGDTSNSVSFDRNGIVRPGICGMDDVTGEYLQSRDIYGINFSTPPTDDTVHFGASQSFTVNNVSDQQITTEVPNVVGNVGLVVTHDGSGEPSNSFPFLATAPGAGLPYINEISPTAGPVGQYVTIVGSGFGSLQGRVIFDNGILVDGSFNFPAVCGNEYWQDDRIVVKIPNDSNLPIGGPYPLYVIRNSDSEESNRVNISVTAGSPGPQVCLMEPDNGPAGTEVDLFGENFGVATGVVNFPVDQTVVPPVYQSVVPSGPWNDNQALAAAVPDTAETGLVFLENAGGDVSLNGMPFEVASCPDDNYCITRYGTPGNLDWLCCPGNVGSSCVNGNSCDTTNSCSYTWNVLTETDQLTVTEWQPDCNDACSSVSVEVEFNNDLNWMTVAAADANGDFDLIGPSGDINTGITQLSDNRLRIDYVPPLEFGATYQAVVPTTFYDNLDGDNLDAPETHSFTVGDTECVITGAEVSPAVRGSSYQTQPSTFSVRGIDNSTSCGPTYTYCTNCSYNWSLSGFTNAGAAHITAGTEVLETVEVITDLANGADSGNVDAILTDNNASPAASFSDSGTLNINITGVAPGTDLFQPVEWRPNCDFACDNGQVDVRFNHDLDPATVNGTNIFIQDMSEAGQPNETTGITPIGLRMFRIDHQDFELGHVYQVTVTDDVYDNHSPANQMDGDVDGIPGGDLVWTFIVGTSQCVVTGIDIVPDVADHTFDHVGAPPTPYTVLTVNSSVNCGTTPIYCDLCSYDWQIVDTNIADIPAGPYTDSVPVTIDNNAVDGDSTVIRSLVSDQGTNFNDSETLLVSLTTPPVSSYLAPEIIDYDPTTGGVCLNASPIIEFSEMMDPGIVSHLTVYEECGVTLCPIAGTWELASRDLVTGAGYEGNETAAIFRSDNLLNPNLGHWVVIDDVTLLASTDGEFMTAAGAASLVGTPLGGATLGWNFATHDQTCEINHVSLDPAPDLFTCAGRNDCEGDAPAGGSGNQHEYVASVYDIGSNLLNPNFMDFTWSLNGTTISVSETLDTPLNGVDRLFGTAQVDNGINTLSVVVDSTMDNSDAVDGAQIETFICENVWPSVTLAPWMDSLYNFSTKYCFNSGLQGAVELPYLNYPAVPVAPTPTGFLREYIFPIYNPITKLDSNYANQLGSLAYYPEEPKYQQEESWWKKLARTILGTDTSFAQNMNGLPLCVPGMPANVNVDDVDATHVTISWPAVSSNQHNSEATAYIIARERINPPGAWSVIGSVGTALPLNYTDNNVQPDTTYEYSVAAFAGNCMPPQGTVGAYSVPQLVTTSLSASPSIDIIGIRIASNPEHLSVTDWYAQHAPNPEQAGELTTIDGYEALRVGNTSYIAGSNIHVGANSLYTNIYIVAHSIGARDTTVDIYDQLVENFKLNTNLYQDIENTCEHQSLTCSSDFDCPAFCSDNAYVTESDCLANGESWTSDWCNSQKLKLTRDTKRLGDLMSIKTRLDEYSLEHRACRNNPGISCQDSSDCPNSEPCDPFYPVLASGSYLQGMSTSKWPSWSQTLAPTLGIDLEVDPVNLLNGCDSQFADPETCWDDSSLEFQCNANSLIYIYDAVNNGREFRLMSQFEYDDHSINVVWDGDLYPEGRVSDIDWLDSDMTGFGYCDGSMIGAPGAGTGPYCGNGIVDGTEVCDGGFNDFICDATNGNQDWWNEQSVGCNPPGTIDAGGNLIECTWYTPDPALTPEQCGGYCGDGTIQSFYENCEGSTFDGSFICADASHNLYCGGGCQALCDDPAGTDYPAAQCNDGVWSEGIEQCDGTANPSGLSSWDCTEGGVLGCDNSCIVTCSVGIPYQGACGNGVVDSGEDCDYFGYVPPDPPSSGIANTYTCTSQCAWSDDYCGDGELDGAYNEICDYAMAYSRPETFDSEEFVQYECRSGGLYTDATTGLTYGSCSATQGGWCGDGQIQGVYDETCDPGDPWETPVIPPSEAPILPNLTGPGENEQYICQEDCTGRTGGYCGDGIAQTEYGELCDTLDYPDRPTPAMSSINDTYACEMEDPSRKCQEAVPGLPPGVPGGGGYCGDAQVQALFGEACDDGTNNSGYSQSTNVYCSTDCSGIAPFCGDGIIQSDPAITAPYPAEVCDGSISCHEYDPIYVSGEIACENFCTSLNDGGCCTQNQLSAKFLPDQHFKLYVNGTQLHLPGTTIDQGTAWQQCAGGNWDSDQDPSVVDPFFDPDNDGLENADDNCPWDANPTQDDTDGDGYGDACDCEDGQECYKDHRGACQFIIDDANYPGVFDYQRPGGNVVAFEVEDTGGVGSNGWGVAGTFSCQEMTCQSVCYQGDNAGMLCSDDSDCNNGYCIHPAAGKEGQACETNSFCRPHEWGNPGVPPGDWEYKPSLCIPAAYGVRTEASGAYFECAYAVDSTVRPSEVAGNDWRTTDYIEGSDGFVWGPPAESPYTGGWGNSTNESYWKHMIPGSDPVWTTDGIHAGSVPGNLINQESGETIYCRQLLR